MLPRAPPLTPRSDLLGTALSGLCLVHCLGTPLIVLAAPPAAAVLGRVHPALLVSVTLVAGWSFVPGYRRHRSALVLALAAAGLTLLFSALLAPEEGVAETVLSVAGALVMMGAHLKNRSLMQITTG